MSINKIEMQDDKGNTYYPHTDASIVKYGDSDVATELSKLAKETGTWTPKIAGSTLAGTNTYADQIGHYTKIGNLVFFDFTVSLSAVDSNMSGETCITGFPFAAKRFINVTITELFGITCVNCSLVYLSPANTMVRLRKIDNTSGGRTSIPTTNVTGSSGVGGYGFYEIAN